MIRRFSYKLYNKWDKRGNSLRSWKPDLQREFIKKSSEWNQKLDSYGYFKTKIALFLDSRRNGVYCMQKSLMLLTITYLILALSLYLHYPDSNTLILDETTYVTIKKSLIINETSEEIA